MGLGELPEEALRLAHENAGYEAGHWAKHAVQLILEGSQSRLDDEDWRLALRIRAAIADELKRRGLSIAPPQSHVVE